MLLQVHCYITWLQVQSYIMLLQVQCYIIMLCYVPTAIRGSYTLQFFVVSGGHMRRQVIGETIPFRSPVITNFRAVMRPFSTEGWSELTTGCLPMMSESEILGGGISEITGNFCLVSDIGLGSMST